MGEFDFKVDRVLTGAVEWTGNKVNVAGSIHFIDQARGDEKVSVEIVALSLTMQESMGASSERSIHGKCKLKNII